jgi:phage head maturation protease
MATKTSNGIVQKESRFASQGILELKSVDGELVVSGYIATTHRDSVNDIIKKETLDKWAKEINEGIPRSNKVTYHHDRNDYRVVGVGLKGTARVDTLPDGEFGLYVDTVINKSHELYSDIEYEYKIGALDSFSIDIASPMCKVLSTSSDNPCESCDLVFCF